MNFYDKIHELMRCLHETQEYKKYLEVKEEIKADEALLAQIKEFKQQQRDMQMDYLAGKTGNDEINKMLQQKYMELIKNEKALNFFQAEISLDVMLADMQKILSEGMKEIIEF